MATLPSFLRKVVTPLAPGPEAAPSDPHRLRALPYEDVFFYCKKIDNSRVVREPDPREGRVCWSAVGGACAALTILCLLLAPNVANRLASYRIEELRSEQARLMEQRQGLELREAELLSQASLDQMAQRRGLVTPLAGQVTHLDPKDEGSVAMVRR